jgi:hypothetical protein
VVAEDVSDAFLFSGSGNVHAERVGGHTGLSARNEN